MDNREKKIGLLWLACQRRGSMTFRPREQARLDTLGGLSYATPKHRICRYLRETQTCQV